jgi:hypothetical protein
MTLHHDLAAPATRDDHDDAANEDLFDMVYQEGYQDGERAALATRWAVVAIAALSSFALGLALA